MEILGLDHVQLAMPAGGEAAARPFYENLLGLKEMPKPEPPYPTFTASMPPTPSATAWNLSRMETDLTNELPHSENGRHPGRPHHV